MRLKNCRSWLCDGISEKRLHFDTGLGCWSWPGWPVYQDWAHLSPESNVRVLPHPLNNCVLIFVEFFSSHGPSIFLSSRFTKYSGRVPVPSFPHAVGGNMGKITQFRKWFSNIFLNVENLTAPIEGSRTSQQTRVRRCVETVGGIWATFLNSGDGSSTPEMDVPSSTAGSKVLELSQKHHTSKRCVFTEFKASTLASTPTTSKRCRRRR